MLPFYNHNSVDYPLPKGTWRPGKLNQTEPRCSENAHKLRTAEPNEPSMAAKHSHVNLPIIICLFKSSFVYARKAKSSCFLLQ